MKQAEFEFEAAKKAFDGRLKRYRVYLAVQGEVDIWAYTRRQAIETAEKEYPKDLAVKALLTGCGTGT